MEIFQVIDIAGTAAFSIAGASAAMDKKLDVFGIFIIAFITALGGGTLRDILIGELPVRWMLDPDPVVVVVISAAIAMIFNSAIKNFHRILLLFDSIGLGFFTLLGIKTGIAFGFHPAVSISLGTITACFGGVLRDISLNNIPFIFQKEIYATTCIVGGSVYFVLRGSGIPGLQVDAICIITIVLFRLFAVKYNWKLPSIGK